MVNLEYVRVLEQKVKSLLAKEAIEHVPPLERECRFDSQYFIVPKRMGGQMRPSQARGRSWKAAQHGVCGEGIILRGS